MLLYEPVVQPHPVLFVQELLRWGGLIGSGAPKGFAPQPTMTGRWKRQPLDANNSILSRAATRCSLSLNASLKRRWTRTRP